MNATPPNPPRVGLVLDPAFHRQSRWQVAGMPRFIESFRERFQPMMIPNWWSAPWKAPRTDVVFSLEPGWGAPKLKVRLGRPLVVFSSDPHSKVRWLPSYADRTGLTALVTPYPEASRRLMPSLADRVVDVPWSVPGEWISEEPVRVHGTGIACQGANDHPLYTLRSWCRDFDFIQDHRIGGSVNLVYRGRDYFRWMGNQDAFVVATAEDFPWNLFAVAKFLEVPAAGCLLIAQDGPEVRRLGFDETNAVLFTRETYVDRCREYLDHPEAYLEHRARGRELVRQRHTVQHRMDRLAELFRQLTGAGARAGTGT